MRTAEEIVARIEVNKGGFSFTAEALIPFLTFEQARPFLRPGVTAGEWGEMELELDRESVLAEMRRYMTFAWGKVVDHRGLSASRSQMKFVEWCWLLGDEEAVTFASTGAHYRQYGAPILAYLCERYGFEIPQGEAVARMRRGHPCRDGCEEGCST